MKADVQTYQQMLETDPEISEIEIVTIRRKSATAPIVDIVVPVYITRKQAEKKYGMSPSRLTAKFKAGAIKGFRMGRELRFLEPDIVALSASLEVKPPPPAKPSAGDSIDDLYFGKAVKK